MNWSHLNTRAYEAGLRFGGKPKKVKPNKEYRRFFEYHMQTGRYEAVLVFHRTKVSSATSIIETGFRGPDHPKYVQANGQWGGSGVYTTRKELIRNCGYGCAVLVCLGLVRIGSMQQKRGDIDDIYIFPDARMLVPMWSFRRYTN